MFSKLSGAHGPEFRHPAQPWGVPGLSEWLKALSLENRSREVIAWCEEQGAATLTEVAENREELAHVLGGHP